LSQSEFNALGSKCKIGEKVLAKFIDCSSLSNSQRDLLGAKCEFRPEVLLDCDSVVDSHILGAQC